MNIIDVQKYNFIWQPASLLCSDYRVRASSAAVAAIPLRRESWSRFEFSVLDLVDICTHL